MSRLGIFDVGFGSIIGRMNDSSSDVVVFVSIELTMFEKSMVNVIVVIVGMVS